MYSRKVHDTTDKNQPYLNLLGTHSFVNLAFHDDIQIHLISFAFQKNMQLRFPSPKYRGPNIDHYLNIAPIVDQSSHLGLGQSKP